jgi:Phosphatidylinositol 3- and 4-kinase
LVPPTVMRDGPLGEGSLQLFIDYDPEEHYFIIYEQRPDLHERLKAMAVFDVVMNNTDRKGGHVLLDNDGAIWGIDHGVCFSDDFKLRTVIWDFAGQTIADTFLSPLESLMHSVPISVAALLSDNARAHGMVVGKPCVPHAREQIPVPLAPALVGSVHFANNAIFDIQSSSSAFCNC